MRMLPLSPVAVRVTFLSTPLAFTSCATISPDAVTATLPAVASTCVSVTPFASVRAISPWAFAVTEAKSLFPFSSVIASAFKVVAPVTVTFVPSACVTLPPLAVTSSVAAASSPRTTPFLSTTVTPCAVPCTVPKSLSAEVSV